jgi:DNA-binding FadR family transcriptional regulator
MKAAIVMATALRDRIARGELRPDDPLPFENELTLEFGLSKPTVREALRILENEGLIEVRRGLGGGARVRHPSVSEAAKTIGVYLQIGDVPVMDVWASRERIIASSIERLAAGRPGHDLSALHRRVDDLVAQVGDTASYYLHMIAVGDTAVRLSESATDHLMVVALHHIIEAELAAATAAVTNIDYAIEIERTVAGGWQQVLRHISAGRPKAARLAYDRQAAVVQAALERVAGDVTVGEVVRAEGSRPMTANS